MDSTDNRKAIVFEAGRTGYAIDQVRSPMTVGELKDLLDDLDDDTLFILSHDRGYTYGSISLWDSCHMEEIDGEWTEV